ncbi:MAG TPA: hypothetical protein VNY52_04735 [Solirubrobacteraceae bacterium]|jgi:hypothetical protein|nr:hypothetical protein [Solirubrobacteraceae bacterium]
MATDADAQTAGSEPAWLVPKPIQRLTGDERFSADSFSVLDFWRWAFSDLRTNIVRGVLAEYLVARAVGDPSLLREAWGNWDVTTATGIKVEVKSSAYLQSWNQRKLSSIVFSGLTGREWSAGTNEFAADRALHAQVYVFAVHTCREPGEYDPLKIEDWEFRVMSAAQLAEHGYRSVTLAFLDGHAPTAYRIDELRQAVERAHACRNEAAERGLG